MGGLAILVRGIGDVAKGLERRRQRTENRVGDAVILCAKVVREAALDLARFPFRRRGLWRNVQDAPRRFKVAGSALVESRVNSTKTEATILARAHITTARSKAVKSVLGKLGQSKDLVRKELWIKRGSSRGKTRSHAGHQSRTGLQRVSLSGGLSRFGGSRKRHIREWALPRDLDKRDTVRLRGEALRVIVLQPSLDRNRSKILAHLNVAARSGMK